MTRSLFACGVELRDNIREDAFPFLCVLRKGETVPAAVVARLWNKEYETCARIIDTFKRFSIVRAHMKYMNERKLTIGLHDVVLDAGCFVRRNDTKTCAGF